jgi:hypothetical protein
VAPNAREKAPAKAAAKTAGTAAKGAKAAKAPAKTGATPLKTAAKKAAAKLARPAARAGKPARQAAAAPAPTVADQAKPNLVRDSFTMPEAEYAVLAQVKQACLKAGVEIKKSELLRIGVALLGQMDVPTLQAVLAGLPQLKTGRPRTR